MKAIRNYVADARIGWHTHRWEWFDPFPHDGSAPRKATRISRALCLADFIASEARWMFASAICAVAGHRVVPSHPEGPDDSMRCERCGKSWGGYYAMYGRCE